MRFGSNLHPEIFPLYLLGVRIEASPHLQQQLGLVLGVVADLAPVIEHVLIHEAASHHRRGGSPGVEADMLVVGTIWPRRQILAALVGVLHNMLGHDGILNRWRQGLRIEYNMDVFDILPVLYGALASVTWLGFRQLGLLLGRSDRGVADLARLDGTIVLICLFLIVDDAFGLLVLLVPTA